MRSFPLRGIQNGDRQLNMCETPIRPRDTNELEVPERWLHVVLRQEKYVQAKGILVQVPR
jgi:hypothetical protein